MWTKQYEMIKEKFGRKESWEGGVPKHFTPYSLPSFKGEWPFLEKVTPEDEEAFREEVKEFLKTYWEEVKTTPFSYTAFREIPRNYMVILLFEVALVVKKEEESVFDILMPGVSFMPSIFWRYQGLRAVHTVDEIISILTSLVFLKETNQLISRELSASIDRQDEKGITALMEASLSGDLKSVKGLLELHANTGLRSKTEDKSALDYAVRNGHIEIVEELLKASKAEVNCISREGRSSPLSIAIGRGHHKIALMLIEAGADVKFVDIFDASLLLDAVHISPVTDERCCEVMEMIYILAKKGAPIHVENECGFTPLMSAVHGESANVVERLCQLGADPNQYCNRDESLGQTPLILASGLGRTKMLKILIKYNGDVNLKRLSDGKTALHTAIYWGSAENVAVLLQHDANPNIKDKDGNTALLYALSRYLKEYSNENSKSTQSISMLIQNQKTDLLATNNKGESVIALCEKQAPDLLPLLMTRLAEKEKKEVLPLSPSFFNHRRMAADDNDAAPKKALKTIEEEGVLGLFQ